MNLIPLHDGRPGLRHSLHIDVASPASPSSSSSSSPAAPATPDHQLSTPQLSTTLDFIASDETLDRYHEVISASGWQLATYQRNPVFQNAHNYGNIIFTLGKALITEVRGGKLFQRIQFATDVNPMAKIAHGLYANGFLNAVSVGFIPLRWENGAPPSEGIAASEFRRKYLEQELLEVSAVAIPANPNALALGLQAGAVAKSDLTDLADLIHQAQQGSEFQIPPSPEFKVQNSGGDPLLQLAREVNHLLKHV